MANRSVYTVHHWNTDISNWGEEGNLRLNGNSRLPNTYSFTDIIEFIYINKYPGVNSIVVIKTPYTNEVRPGYWYVKGLNNTNVNYETIRNLCQENHNNMFWSTRDCYLIYFQ